MNRDTSEIGIMALGAALGLSLCFTAAALMAAVQPSLAALPLVLAQEARCLTTTEDPALIAAAQELAEGVTAERDAEIALALPGPYRQRVPATAQLDGDELTVPRALRLGASSTGGSWDLGSMQGRRQRTEKRDCAIGVHVALDLPQVTIVEAVVLWRRAR